MMSADRTAGESKTRSCGHTRHVGTCGACQRAQLVRWQVQLVQASEARMYQPWPLPLRPLTSAAKSA
jgi:hypothetical protein